MLSYAVQCTGNGTVHSNNACFTVPISYKCLRTRIFLYTAYRSIIQEEWAPTWPLPSKTQLKKCVWRGGLSLRCRIYGRHLMAKCKMPIFPLMPMLIVNRRCFQVEKISRKSGCGKRTTPNTRSCRGRLAIINMLFTVIATYYAALALPRIWASAPPGKYNSPGTL